MRMMTGACFAAATMLISHPQSASAGAWCAWYDAYTYNCGFRTLEQCRATVFGDSGAYCAPNPANAYGEPRSRAKTYPRTYIRGDPCTTRNHIRRPETRLV